MKDPNRALSANVWKLQLGEFLHWMLFFMPILIPFLSDRGLVLSQIFILQAAFSITVVLFEVPSGYFADVIGRKHSLLVGTALACVGLVLYGTGQAFAAFLAAEIVFGIGTAFRSGADHALLFDTLAQLRSDTYVARSGRMEFLGRMGEGVAAVVGGVLATASLVLPFWATLVTTLILLVLYATLVEVEHEKGTGSHVSRAMAIFADTVHRNKALKWMIAYATVVGVSTRVAVWMYQPLFSQAGIPIAWFGVLWAITLFVAGGASWAVGHIDSRFGRHRALWLMLALSILGYALTGIVAPVVGVATIMLLQLSRGMQKPVLNDEINALTPSSRRATVLSIQSMAANLTFAAVIAGFGVLAQSDLQGAFLIGSVLFGVLGAVTLIMALFYHRRKD